MVVLTVKGKLEYLSLDVHEWDVFVTVTLTPPLSILGSSDEHIPFLSHGSFWIPGIVHFEDNQRPSYVMISLTLPIRR